MARDMYYTKTNLTNALAIKTASHKYTIPAGELKGHSHVYKFGRNPDVGLEEEIIWDGGNGYTFLTSNSTLDISSDSVEDTMTTGTNAWKIRVEGLVEVDNKWIYQFDEIELNGLTKVSTTNEFIRVNRAYIIQGAEDQPIGGANAGTIKIEQTGTPLTILAQINPNQGQTLMCIYTTPSDCNCFLLSAGSSLAKGQSSNTTLKTRDNAQTNSVFRTKGIRDLYQNSFHIDYDIARVLGEKTDIIMTAGGSAQAIAVSASFEIMIVDKDINLKY